jgi:hypothetical protein
MGYIALLGELGIYRTRKLGIYNPVPSKWGCVGAKGTYFVS